MADTERELKFRAWDNTNKKWAYEGFHLFGEVTIFDLLQLYKLEDACKSLSFQQFTGLLDKNGKEIYEGDMCLIFTDEPTEVVFENGAFGYLDSGGYFISFAQNMWFYWDSRSQTKEIEVIGNIYENQELIKCSNITDYKQ